MFSAGDIDLGSKGIALAKRIYSDAKRTLSQTTSSSLDSGLRSFPLCSHFLLFFNDLRRNENGGSRSFGKKFPIGDNIKLTVTQVRSCLRRPAFASAGRLWEAGPNRPGWA